MNVQPATTPEEFKALVRQYDSAQIVACQSDDLNEVMRANARLLETAAAIYKSPFEYDGDGNLLAIK